MGKQETKKIAIIEFRNDPRLSDSRLRQRLTSNYYKYRKDLGVSIGILKFCRDIKSTNMVPEILPKIIYGLFPIISACAEYPDTIRVNKTVEYISQKIKEYPDSDIRLHLATIAMIYSVYDFITNSDIHPVSYLKYRVPDVYLSLISEEIEYHDKLTDTLFYNFRSDIKEENILPETVSEFISNIGSLKTYAETRTLTISKSTLYRMAKNECTYNRGSRSDRIEFS